MNYIKKKIIIYFEKYLVDDELKLYINYELFKKSVLSKLWTEEEKDDFYNGNIFKVLYPNGFLFFSFLIITVLIGVYIFILYKCYIKNIKLKDKNPLLNDNINNSLINKGENVKKRKKENKKDLEKGKELEEI